ncbi:MAG: tetratricopeptide repeat protein [Acidimicrobiia bacterium]|nr:tetratricopeptide repeat protein [Acidimicrobiia bacterium]
MPFVRACPIVLAAIATACSGSGPSRDELLTRAKAFAAEGKHAEAIIEYRRALELNARDGDARLGLAEAYEASGQPVSAYREYVNAADERPDDIPTQLKAAEYLLAAERFDDARDRAERVLLAQPDHVSALIVKGTALAGLRDLDGALDDMQEAASLDPDDARPWAALGALRMIQGKGAEAEELLRRAVALPGATYSAYLSLANYYWSTGRTEEAEPLVRTAAEKAPNSVSAQRALAFLLLTTGRVAEAEGPLKAAVAAADDLRTRLALADYYVLTGRGAAARPVLEEIAGDARLRDGGGATAAATRLASIDFAAGRAAEAHGRLDAVLARDARNSEALQVKARILLAERRLDPALDAARTAAEADSSSSPAQHLLGSVLAARGEREAAIAAFSEAARLNPQAVASRVQLSQLTLAGGSATALGVAQEARSLSGGPEVALANVRALLARGDVARAEPILRRLMEEHPEVALLHAQMGGLQLLKKDRRAATAAFERARELDPASLGALNGLVAIALMEKDQARAQALVEERLKAAPDEAAVLMLAAEVAGASGDLTTYETRLRRVVERDPANIKAFGALASLYVSQGKLPAARAEFQAIARRRPDATAALTMVGLLFEAEGQADAARTAYEDVLARAPDSPVAANNLAWMFAEGGGNLDQALDLAQAAVRRQPGVPQFSDTLGWVYYKKGLATQAVQAFEQSVKAEPTRATYHYHLGLALAAAGDRAGALGALSEALRLQPDFRDAAAARAKVLTD